jgi:hypothetical protein
MQLRRVFMLCQLFGGFVDEMESKLDFNQGITDSDDDRFEPNSKKDRLGAALPRKNMEKSSFQELTHRQTARSTVNESFRHRRLSTHASIIHIVRYVRVASLNRFVRFGECIRRETRVFPVALHTRIMCTTYYGSDG